MTLHEFLALPHRFRWGGIGGEDCMTFDASWVLDQTGEDPAEEFRGTYSTAEEAHAIIERHGGLVALSHRLLTPIGLTRVSEPDSGDVGVIKAPSALDGGFTEIAAVRFGPLWATMSPGRVRATLAEHVAVWRLPC